MNGWNNIGYKGIKYFCFKNLTTHINHQDLDIAGVDA